jgi:hypothetical protein
LLCGVAAAGFSWAGKPKDASARAAPSAASTANFRMYFLTFEV